MTSWPCSARRLAATDESTPPDIATTTRMSAHRGRDAASQPAQLGDERWKNAEDEVNFGRRGRGPETEAQGIARPRRRESHRAQDVRGLEGAGGACRSGRDGDAFEVERD